MLGVFFFVFLFIKGLAQNGVVLLTTHFQEAKLGVSKAAKRPRRREARVLLTMAY